MLAPKTDRLDYGEQLKPPMGYELDAAIATTYTLDMEALLIVPIALCFNDTLDKNLKGESLALLEAVSRISGKLKVFYQKGNIKRPSKFNKLFTLLEPSLQPIIPEENASFHPKMWLLRFVKIDGKKSDIKYRLIILSRNLTFDKSWDIAVSLDGVIDKKNADPYNRDWIEYIKELLSEDEDFEPADRIIKDLPKLVWQAPEKFNDAQLLTGGGEYGCPVDIEQSNNDILMVVSPFIKSGNGKVEALNWLADAYAPDGKKYLFSRTEELNSIGEEKLRNWECFSMNENVINGDERLELSEKDGTEDLSHNLHAKIIINQKESRAYWHLGSANATVAALGDNPDSEPRNREMMVSIWGFKSKVGPELIKEQWLENHLFVKHEFSEDNYDDTVSLQTISRQITHRLISAKWELKGRQKESGYKIDVFVDIDLIKEPLPEGVAVKVEQLAIQGIRGLSSEMQWDKVDVKNISALIPVSIEIDKNGEFLKKDLIIEAKVTLDGGDCRIDQIMKSIVDSDEKILNYIHLMLQVTPDKNQWLSLNKQEMEGIEGSNFILSGTPIFEQLLIAYSRHPEQLKRVASLINRLRSSGVDIPQEFAELWAHFEKEIGADARSN